MNNREITKIITDIKKASEEIVAEKYAREKAIKKIIDEGMVKAKEANKTKWPSIKEYLKKWYERKY